MLRKQQKQRTEFLNNPAQAETAVGGSRVLIQSHWLHIEQTLKGFLFFFPLRICVSS